MLLAPARLEPFGFDADLSRLLLAKQIEGQLTQDGEILIGMAAAHARLIFPKGDIEHPMHTIFNAPMATNRRSTAVIIAAKTVQMIARFLLHLLTNSPAV